MRRMRVRRGLPLLALLPLGAMFITAGSCGPATLISAPLIVDDPTYLGNPDGPLVAVAGDSITVQSAWAIHATLDPTYSVRIASSIGETTDQMVGGVPFTNITELAASKPDIVVINLGTNDGPKTPEQILANLAALRAMFPATACFVPVTISTHGIGGFAAAAADARIVNPALPTEHLADWNAALDADPTLVNPNDGVHPAGERGEQMLTTIYADAIATCPAPDKVDPTTSSTAPDTTTEPTTPDPTTPDPTDPPTSEPPTSEPPTTEPPTTESPTTETPTTPPTDTEPVGP